MATIKILPIFNQAEQGVWDDFARIESDTMIKNYNMTVSGKEFDHMIHVYKQDWAKGRNNFTFAAYDNGQMIGFIRGDIKNSNAFVSGLYVLEACQGKRVGTQLLSCVENYAVMCKSRYMELMPLWDAMDFYRKQGYQEPWPGHHFYKDLKGKKCSGTVPVFKSTKQITTQCETIASQNAISFQIGMVYEPLLVLFTSGELVGFANHQGVFMANGYKRADFLRNRLIADYNAIKSR